MMINQPELLEQLETPCVVIDIRKAKENIKRMQKTADEAGCMLRPHIKTHKMPLFAKLQIEAGAKGITCAKVGEAEVMADGGIDDIFIAYPMVGDFRVHRVITLAKRIRRLIVGVDSLDIALPLSKAAADAGITLEIRLEVDTGAKRTGCSRERVVELACKLAELPNLKLTGIYTFKGLVCGNEPTVDSLSAAKEEGSLMAGIAEAIRNAGVEIQDVSAGSTPTGVQVAQTGLVNEIRPGTYIFNDYMLFKEGAASLDDVAARIYATTVSTPESGYAVIDGGTKTFPMDILLDTDPYNYRGYAVPVGNDDLQLRRMNEEHGILTSLKGNTGLHVGDIVELYPVHICTAINQQNHVYIYDGEKLWKEKVSARGMLV